MTDKPQNKNTALIDDLVGQLNDQPQRRMLSPLMLAFALLPALLAATLAAMAWRQPFRDGFLFQLLEHPFFLAENTLGIIAIICLFLAAVRSAIPGEGRTMLYFGLLALTGWLLIIFSGLIEPVLHPSMAGKREHCHLEALYYSLPLSAIFAIIVWRRYSLNPWVSATLAALAAAMIPAVFMQLTCMYEANHGVQHHVLPALATTVIATPLIWIFLCRCRGI